MRRSDREVTSREDIISILDSCKTASVAMLDGDKPYVVPLSYGYEFIGGTLVLYFHCAREGHKLNLLASNDAVCFTIYSEGYPVHAETPCDSGYYYSSIIGSGRAEMVEDVDEKRHALTKMFERQAGRIVDFTAEQAGSVCVFRIVSQEYTGKRKAKPE